MRNIFSMLALLGCYVVISSCGKSGDSLATAGESYRCDEPIQISSEDNQPAPGFIVYINKTKKTSEVEAEYAQKYNDMTIFSSFPRNNSFYANFNDESIKLVQCETDVIAIAEM